MGGDTIVVRITGFCEAWPGSPAARAGIKEGEFVTRARFAKKDEPIDEDDPGVELSEESQSWPFVMAMVQQSPKDTRLQLTVKSSDGLARDVHGAAHGLLAHVVHRAFSVSGSGQ